jgi:hypothetical protein
MQTHIPVSAVEEVLSLSAARIYQLIQEQQLEAITRYVEGRGWCPTVLVSKESIMAYARKRYAMQPGSALEQTFTQMLNTHSRRIVRDLGESEVNDIKASYAAGESIYHLSYRYKVSAGSMRSLLQRLEVPLRTHRQSYDVRDRQWVERLNPAQREFILLAYQEGHGLPAIARELDWGKQGAKKVRKVLTVLGIPLRGRGEAAQAQWRARRLASR